MFDDTEIKHVVSESVNLWQYLEFQTFLYKENILVLKSSKNNALVKVYQFLKKAYPICKHQLRGRFTFHYATYNKEIGSPTVYRLCHNCHPELAARGAPWDNFQVRSQSGFGISNVAKLLKLLDSEINSE